MVAVFGAEIPIIELLLVFTILSIIILVEIIVVLVLLLKHRQQLLGKKGEDYAPRTR